MPSGTVRPSLPGEAQERPGEAGRHVEERGLAQEARVTAEGAAQDGQQAHRGPRRLFEQREERLALEHEQVDRLDRHGVGAVGLAIEHGERPEEVAGTDEVDD